MLNTPLFEDWAVGLQLKHLRQQHRTRARRLTRIFVALTLPLGLMVLAAVLERSMATCVGGHHATARAQAAQLGHAVNAYQLQNRAMPPSLGALTASRGPFDGPVIETIPRDPWGNAFVLLTPGLRDPARFDVVSAGPDGLFFTGDDVGNWSD